MKNKVLLNSGWALAVSALFYGSAWLVVAGVTLLHLHWATIRGQLTHLLFYGFMFLAARALWHLGGYYGRKS